MKISRRRFAMTPKQLVDKADERIEAMKRSAAHLIQRQQVQLRFLEDKLKREVPLAPKLAKDVVSIGCDYLIALNKLSDAVFDKQCPPCR